VEEHAFQDQQIARGIEDLVQIRIGDVWSL
jgi:hypothetical protein